MNGSRIAGSGLLALALACTGCWWTDDDDRSSTGTTRVLGSGILAEENRQVNGIGGIHFGSIGNLTLIPGGTESLVVRAEDNLIDHILASVEGGTLYITTESGYDLQPTRTIEYVLTVVDIDRVQLSGVGSVTSSDLATASLELLLAGVGDLEFSSLDVDDLTVQLSGVGGVILEDLDAETLDATQSGVGSIRVSGSATAQTVGVSGVGDYEAENLASVEATLVLESDSSATVRVSDVLVVDIRDDGSVYYYGDPVVHETVTGTGSCVCLGS